MHELLLHTKRNSLIYIKIWKNKQFYSSDKTFDNILLLKNSMKSYKMRFLNDFLNLYVMYFKRLER